MHVIFWIKSIYLCQKWGLGRSPVSPAGLKLNIQLSSSSLWLRPALPKSPSTVSWPVDRASLYPGRCRGLECLTCLWLTLLFAFHPNCCFIGVMNIADQTHLSKPLFKYQLSSVEIAVSKKGIPIVSKQDSFNWAYDNRVIDTFSFLYFPLLLHLL